MNRLGSYVFAALFSLPLLVSAAESSDADLIKSLARSKHSLVEGIAQAEKANGAAISAKFELEDGKLSLSVYTAKEGFDKDAEDNVLMELSGDPKTGKWQPKSGGQEILTFSPIPGDPVKRENSFKRLT